MKKFFLLAILGVGLFHVAQAQEKKFVYGIKGGVNFSKFRGDVADEVKTKVGMYAGITLDAFVAKQISISPELYYSQQGVKMNDDFSKSQFSANYLNLPVLVKYHISRLSLATGPQIGFLLSARDKYKENDGSFEANDNAKDDLKSTDFSWAFGLGYKIYKGLGIDGRYNLGLSNIVKGNEAKLKNNVFQVGLNYTF